MRKNTKNTESRALIHQFINMLIIGDIHIHPRHGDGIIQMLRDFVNNNDHEQHVVFVGDYVYHFAYHRPSLLSLLDFFLELVQMGKMVYVLAGNHDWLGQHFVYDEGKKVVEMKSGKGAEEQRKKGDLIGEEQSFQPLLPENFLDFTLLHLSTPAPSGLHFITSPQIVRIESEDVFFLPYMLSWKNSDELNQFVSTTVEEWYQRSKGAEEKRNAVAISSLHLSEPCSLTIIHHYYVAETAFPGLKVKFTYKDLALAPHWLDDKRVRLISGHIHHPFCYKNYLCVGAVRSMSPQEVNQLHYLFSYDLRTGESQAHQIAYNTYLQIEHVSSLVDEHFLQVFWTNLQSHHQNNLQAGQYALSVIPCDLDIAKVSLAVMSNQLEYDTLNEHIEPQLMQGLADVKLKRSYGASDLIVAQLIDETQNFSSGRGDRKQLLGDYLSQKFGDRKSVYEEMLKEVGV